MGNSTIHFRISEQDRRHFDKIARKLDMSASDMARLALSFWYALDEAGGVDVFAALRKKNLEPFSSEVLAQIASDYLARLGARLAFELRTTWESTAINKAFSGEPLSEAETAFVSRFANNNSSAIALSQAVEALKAAGSLPVDLPDQIDHEAVLRAWSQLQAGKITQAAFDEQIAYMTRFPCGEFEPDDD